MEFHKAWFYIGPLLFNTFVNDLPSVVQSPLVFFADDAKLYRAIQSDDDYSKLQQDLDNLLVTIYEN